MSNVITAQELFDKMVSENPNVEVTEVMIEFAKLHVNKALRAAHTQAADIMDGRCWQNVYDRSFILKSYSETMVK